MARFAIHCALTLLLSGVIGSAGSLCAADVSEEVLRKHGLTRLGERVWVLPLEIELRGKLLELPKRREQLIAAEKNLDGFVERNRRVWTESRPAATALAQSLARYSSAYPQRELIERQIKALAASASEPRKLGTRADVRTLVVELASVRCEMLAAIAWIRETVPSLVDRYRTLMEEAEVSQALSAMGEGQRLGPQRTYKADLTRLADFERLAATPWVPTFQQSGQTRLTALVEERAPVTFTWVADDDQPVVLTASAAAAAGLSVPADAVSQRIAATPDREVRAQRITIGYLRLGKCVVRGVRAYVLPPEAEDLGNRLGSAALAGHQVRLDPEQLRMWIDEER